jgi:large subunit ribosomal protein L24
MSKRILKGDQVLVLRGIERGKKGKVLKILPDQKTALVEGLNFQSKHTRPTQKRQQGGVLKKEGPIHLSKLLLVCPKCGEATRVGRMVLQDGQKARVCKKCGEMI